MSPILILNLELDPQTQPVVVVVVVGLVALLAVTIWAPLCSTAATPQALPEPSGSFYLTEYRFSAIEAPTACSTGYHMASLWEILEPSHLAYDVTLGLTADDSGLGPPTGSAQHGWLRTGYGSANSPPAGQANCNAWTTATGTGTVAYLPDDWTAGNQDIGVWVVLDYSAVGAAVPRVWCVSHELLYLPTVYRQ